MSGTSFDGVDVSLVRTDGYNYLKEIHSTFLEYNDTERKLYKSSLFNNFLKAKEIIDLKHILCIKKLLKQSGFNSKMVDVIGLHGQTFAHNPEEQWSWQYINADRIAKNFKTKVISELRLKDINNGGEGAPLVPIFHKLLSNNLNDSYPLAILNIGGITNVTIIESVTKFSGFDIGPGNGPLDSIIYDRLKLPIDLDGKIAEKGRPNLKIMNNIISKINKNNKSFSFDRNKLDNICRVAVKQLGTSNALATLVSLICELVFLKINKFKTNKIILVGGGRKNKFLVRKLKKTFKNKSSVILAEELGWNGDSIEAQAFGYLAVRSLLGLNITFTQTTGTNFPISGGVLYNVID